jgi:hypothetical protein
MQVRRSCRQRTADHNESLPVSSLKVRPVVFAVFGMVSCRAGRGIRAAARRAGAGALARVKDRGALISARIFRAAFGTDPRQDIAKYVIAVEVPSHPQHSQHDADPGSRSSTGSPTISGRGLRWCTADRCCTLSDRHSASASAPGCHNADHPERLLMKRAGNAIRGRSSGRPGQPRNRGEGGQPLRLITERDERMKCLYVTASPAEIGMPDLMRDPRRSPRAHNT